MTGGEEKGRQEGRMSFVSGNPGDHEEYTWHGGKMRSNIMVSTDRRLGYSKKREEASEGGKVLKALTSESVNEGKTQNFWSAGLYDGNGLVTWSGGKDRVPMESLG